MKHRALFYDGSDFCSQGIKPANAVDTMGAGDSFIAGFLTRYEDTGKMGEALDYAAERAALSCGVMERMIASVLAITFSP